MITFGILLLLTGIGSAIYGNTLNNDMNAQLNSMFGNGVKNPGDIWIYCGAAVALIGVTLIICGVIKQTAKERRDTVDVGSQNAVGTRGLIDSNRVFGTEEEREQALQRLEIAVQNGTVSANEYTRLRAEMIEAPLAGNMGEKVAYRNATAKERWIL